MSRKIGVIGAGSWGTALALLLANKGEQVSLWGYHPDHVELLQRERQNKRYLPGFGFPPSLTPTPCIRDAVDRAAMVCMVVPSHGYRDVFSQVVTRAPERVIYVSATKGIENKSLLTMTQVMEQCIKEAAIQPSPALAVLSGPSFAREVAEGVPTAITIGSSDSTATQYLQSLFSTEFFRVYTSRDMIGLEISAALKNIIAIAAGICDGLDFGSNARAALITRGLAEMTRFGTVLGAEQQTFYGLSGLGDLVLTCTGALSRNRHVGMELGRGKTLESILGEMSMVAEGVKTTRSIYDMARKPRWKCRFLSRFTRYSTKARTAEPRSMTCSTGI